MVLLILAAIAAYCLSFGLVAVDLPFHEAPVPGWQALLLALSPVTGFQLPSDPGPFGATESYLSANSGFSLASAYFVVSALTNLIFLTAVSVAVAHRFRGWFSREALSRVAGAVAFAAAFNSAWLLLSLDANLATRPGYVSWVCSFALVALALARQSRVRATARRPATAT